VYRFIGKDDETEDYDASGRLIRITSRSGLTQTMSYDVCSRLTAVADDFGHALTFEYDGVVPSTEADCRLVDWRLRRMIDPSTPRPGAC
jgi:YD repeat-containing protein